MTLKYGKLIVFELIFLLFTQACPAAERLPVFVSIIPQKYFVQQIGMDLVDVHVMVGPGASPATYEPKPKQMARLSKAVIYFSIGVPFENAWLDKIAAANPRMNVVHTDRSIQKIPMEVHDHHYDRESGASGILDPHIWLSPVLAKIQAKSIRDALQDAIPTHRSELEANFQAFASRIDQLDHRLRSMLKGKHGLQFMVFHPAWGYFARTYDLEQLPIEFEGKNPKPAELQAMITHARQNGIKVVFVQPQFSTKSAELVAKEIGGEVVFADPLAEDWLANLQEVAEIFKAALK
jgi:zinc transport system substrate-binding protein